MTAEHRILFGLNDIVAITFECTKCGVRLAMAPEKVETDHMRQCPSCSAIWLANDTHMGPIRGGPFTHLLIALRALAEGAKGNEPKPDFNLRLEFTAPEK